MKTSATGYSRLAKFATLLALIVVMLGAYTRLGDAGLGCPDWPGCYGHLTVPKTSTEIAVAQQSFQQTVEPAKAWKEMVHRYFAGTLGILILVLAIWAVIRKRHNPHQPIFTPIFLVLLVLFQAVLGMWTVTWKVLPLIVSSHLLGGMAITALLWYLTLASRAPVITLKKEAIDFRPWAIVGLLIVICQIFLGAWTSTNYAAIVCEGFPMCQGSLFPHMNFHTAFDLFHPIGVNYEGGVLDNTARVTIQMMHRYGAFITLIYVGILSFVLMLSQKAQGLRKLGRMMLAVLILQILLGIINVVFLLPMHAAVLHNGVAVILLLTMVTLIYQLYSKVPRE